MSIEAELVKRAREIAEAMHERRSSLVEKKAELEAQLRSLDAELASPVDTDRRLAAFQPKIGDDLQCPYCWIYDGAQRPLSAMGRGAEDAHIAAEVDLFRCHSCNNPFSSEGNG